MYNVRVQVLWYTHVIYNSMYSMQTISKYEMESIKRI